MSSKQIPDLVARWTQVFKPVYEESSPGGNVLSTNSALPVFIRLCNLAAWYYVVRRAFPLLNTLTLRPFAAQQDDTFWQFQLGTQRLDAIRSASQPLWSPLTSSASTT